MRANLEAFRRWRIVPRMLRDVSERDLRTTVLGTQMPAPVLLAPVGVQTILHPGRRARDGTRCCRDRIAGRRQHRRGALDGGGRAGGRRRAQVVPALLAQGGRDHEEPGQACRAGRISGARRDARLGVAGLAPDRPVARRTCPSWRGPASPSSSPIRSSGPISRRSPEEDLQADGGPLGAGHQQGRDVGRPGISALAHVTADRAEGDPASRTTRALRASTGWTA